MAKDILIIPSSSANPQIQFSGSAYNSIHLEVLDSGSVSFESRNSGSLFSIVDSMSGSLMAVSDISGLPILEVFSSDRVVAGQFGKETLDINGLNAIIGSNDTSGSITLRGVNEGDPAVTGQLYYTSSDAFGGSLNLRVLCISSG